MDQPVPEIKTPILKSVQKKLSKVADWFLLYVPPEIKKTANDRVEKLRVTINDIVTEIFTPAMRLGLNHEINMRNK